MKMKVDQNAKSKALFIEIEQYVQVIEFADEPSHSTKKTIMDLKHLILQHLYSD